MTLHICAGLPEHRRSGDPARMAKRLPPIKIGHVTLTYRRHTAAGVPSYQGRYGEDGQTVSLGMFSGSVAEVTHQVITRLSAPRAEDHGDSCDTVRDLLECWAADIKAERRKPRVPGLSTTPRPGGVEYRRAGS